MTKKKKLFHPFKCIQHQQNPHKNKSKAFRIALLVSFLLVSIIYLQLETFRIGVASLEESYTASIQQTSQEISDNMYQDAFAYAKENHYVVNRGAISIGNLQEKQNLEVLRVSETTYQISEKEEGFLSSLSSTLGFGSLDSWIEVPATGTFLVNLQLAEFIVDNQRNSVVVRIPNPVLSDVTIDHENVQILFAEDGSLVPHSTKEGVNQAASELQQAQSELLKSMRENQEYYQIARTSAKTLLETLIRQWNPGVDNLTVTVEFFSDNI